MNSVTRIDLLNELNLLQSALQIVLVKLSLLSGVIEKSGILFDDPLSLRNESYEVARCHLSREFYQKKFNYLQERITKCNEKLLIISNEANNVSETNERVQEGLEEHELDYYDILTNLSIEIPSEISQNSQYSSQQQRPNSIRLPFPPVLSTSSQVPFSPSKILRNQQSLVTTSSTTPPQSPSTLQQFQSSNFTSPITPSRIQTPENIDIDQTNSNNSMQQSTHFSQSLSEESNSQIITPLTPTPTNNNDNNNNVLQRRASLSIHSPQKQIKLSNWRREIHPHLEKCYIEMKKIIPRDIFNLSKKMIEIIEFERILVTVYGYSTPLANRIIQKKCLWLISLPIIQIMKMSDDELLQIYTPKGQNLDVVELSAVYYVLDPLIDESRNNDRLNIQTSEEILNTLNEMSEKRLEMIHKLRKKLKHLLNQNNSDEFQFNSQRHPSYSSSFLLLPEKQETLPSPQQQQHLTQRKQPKALKYEEI